MLIDPYMRTLLVELRLQEQIAAAERDRIARLARPRRAWRLGMIRLAARGLRVEREIEFKAAHVDGC
jgi:hypothetical protein